jgi:hypothetical protein
MSPSGKRRQDFPPSILSFRFLDASKSRGPIGANLRYTGQDCLHTVRKPLHSGEQIIGYFSDSQSLPILLTCGVASRHETATIVSFQSSPVYIANL